MVNVATVLRCDTLTHCETVLITINFNLLLIYYLQLSIFFFFFKHKQ